MASFLQELQEENKKQGLFTSNAISISYPLGFPILDQELGAIYVRTMEDGTIVRDKQIGVPAGSFTIFCGQTSSGKTTAAIQAATNIVEPFGDRGCVIHRDAEKSTSLDRVRTISGWSLQQMKDSYILEKENNTWEHLLTEIIATGKKKEALGKDMMYNTGHKDIYGNDIWYYVPTVVIVDSLSKFLSEKEAIDVINGLTGGGRGAIYNGIFFRNALEPMYKYNINVFVIVHLDDAMPEMNGRQKPKQMTFMPNGKYLSGGHKSKLFTSSIINFRPIATKDEIKTEEENGWNGVPTEMYVIKSRTSRGGFSVIGEFIQEAGFDSRLTLMRFAREKGIIAGRNPGCYFTEMPDVKFDTRCIIKELAEKPQLTRALFTGCRPLLDELIPVVDTSNDDDLIRGSKGKIEAKNLMREMFEY